MYHVELRQFPHNFCRFNLTEAQLRETVLSAWARGELFELGERSWDPRQAKLTVLEGPRMPVAQLSMGRGWRAASRQGEDVTERVLGSARSAPVRHAASDDASGGRAAALGLEVLGRLGAEPTPVALAWRVARERDPHSSAGDCLKLAESALASLVRAGLVVLLRERSGGAERLSGERQVAAALLEVDSWVAQASAGGLLMMRAPVAQR